MQIIQLKRGTYAALLALDPVPEDGEIILDTDSGNFKIGDGARSWNSLPYANISVNSLKAALINDFDAAVTAVLATAIASKTLSSLFDVSDTPPANNDVLMSVAGAWAPSTPQAITPHMWQAPPATSDAAGTPGQIAYDNEYVYICVSLNTWVRAALETW